MTKTIFCVLESVKTMEKDAKKAFKLYAMPLTAENVAVGSRERFCRATPTPQPGYVLVYTDADAPKQAVEITQDSSKLLTQADVRWLFDSNAAIIAEEIELNKPQIMKRLSDSVETLETELQRKKEEILQKGE